LERINYMRPEEVAATEWFDQYAPSGSIMTFMIQNSPYPIGADYHLHLTPSGHYAADVLTDDQYVRRSPLTARDVVGIHELLLDIGAAKTYLTINSSQIAYTDGFGYLPIGTLPPFIQSLLDSDQFYLVFHKNDTYVFEVLNTRT
jgi:hypothetical protein